MQGPLPSAVGNRKRPTVKAVAETGPGCFMDRSSERLVTLFSDRFVTFSGEHLDEDNWNELIDTAKRLSVAQMLAGCLKEQDISPPPAALDRIHTVFNELAGNSILRHHELETILESFGSAGITVIPLKGAWLSEAVYANIAQRKMGDVDLWIEREQLDEARRILGSMGYSSRSKRSRPQALQDELSGETQLFKDGAPLVELHWNIFSGEWLRHTARIDESEIYQRTLPFRSKRVRQLSPEDAVIHICVHLAVNHQMSLIGLRTMLDLQYAREKLTFDWDELARRARKWHVSNATWLVLNMLEKSFGDPEGHLPLESLRPSFLRRRLLMRFISPWETLDNTGNKSGPKQYIFLLALADRPVDSALLAWRALMPDRRWLTLRYGLQGATSWRIWLQRVWHPLRTMAQRNI